MFQPLFRYFKLNVKNGLTISSWKSTGLPTETVHHPCTSNVGHMLDFYDGSKFRVNFIGGYLKQPNVWYKHKNVVNIYIVYELEASTSTIMILKKFLFGAVTLTKNTDTDKYGYPGYGIGFDRRSSY